MPDYMAETNRQLASWYRVALKQHRKKNVAVWITEVKKTKKNLTGRVPIWSTSDDEQYNLLR